MCQMVSRSKKNDNEKQGKGLDKEGDSVVYRGWFGEGPLIK